MAWIPIEERLPTKSGWYRIKFRSGAVITIPYSNTAGGKMVWVIVSKFMEKYSHKDSLQGVSLVGQTTMPSIPSASAFGITFELVSWMLRIIAEARVLYFWFSTGKIFPATFTLSSKNFECPKLTIFLYKTKYFSTNPINVSDTRYCKYY